MDSSPTYLMPLRGQSGGLLMENLSYPRENDHINIGVWKIGVEIEIFALSILRIENDGI